MKLLKLEPCVAPAWAKSGHSQTLIAHFLKSPKLAETAKRFEVALSDGDILVGSFYLGTSGTTVSIFHGLTGSADSGYMQRSAIVARSFGHSVLLMNHRGCGSGVGLAKNPYHSGRAEDISAVVKKLREVRPQDRQIVIGFSLGANALLLLASSEDASLTKPDAAVAFNAPIHLEDAALALKVGLNRIYDLQFVMECRRDVQIRNAADNRFQLSSFSRLGTLHDFDDWYTAPASGFKNREDYYERCSTFSKLDKITLPVVIITADDDPFVSVAHYRSAPVSATVQMHVEQVGGHMGYLSKNPTPLGTNRWMDYALHEALAAFE